MRSPLIHGMGAAAPPRRSLAVVSPRLAAPRGAAPRRRLAAAQQRCRGMAAGCWAHGSEPDGDHGDVDGLVLLVVAACEERDYKGFHTFPSNITRHDPPITRDFPPSLLILQGRSLTVQGVLGLLSWSLRPEPQAEHAVTPMLAIPLAAAAVAEMFSSLVNHLHHAPAAAHHLPPLPPA